MKNFLIIFKNRKKFFDQNGKNLKFDAASEKSIKNRIPNIYGGVKDRTSRTPQFGPWCDMPHKTERGDKRNDNSSSRTKSLKVVFQKVKKKNIFKIFK